MPRVRVRSGAPEPKALDVEIAQLRDLDISGLRERWRLVFRKKAPARLSRHLMFRVLAHRMQEKVFGGLDPEFERLLNRLSSKWHLDQKTSGTEERPIVLRPGTVLGREWNGRMYRITVVADGFSFDGATYRSLSKVAFLITGTRWNGPKFFGLRNGSVEGSHQ
jgi:DUF2924 family protein